MELLFGLCVGAAIIAITMLVHAIMHGWQSQPSLASHGLRLDGRPQWAANIDESNIASGRRRRQKNKRRASRTACARKRGSLLVAMNPVAPKQQRRSGFMDNEVSKMSHALCTPGVYVNEYSVILGTDED